MRDEPATVDLSKIRITCERCRLSSLCIPDHLSPHIVSEFDKIVKHRHTLRRGDYLFRNGAEFTALYAVRTGSFKHFTYTDEGDDQILGFYFPGDIIGYDAIYQNRHFSSVMAMETSNYCTVPFTQLEELTTIIPGLQHRLLKLMSREIADDNVLSSMICNKNAEEKIGAFLLTLSERFRQLGYSSTNFRLAMTRQDIGNYLGLSVETVSRILGRLQKDKIVIINNKSVEFLDINRLYELSIKCNNDLIADNDAASCNEN